MRWLLRQSATGGFACSHPAGQALFGGRWTCDPRWRRLYCGIDPARFSGVAEREGVRTELGVPADARLLIHVGRFERQKNHAFLVEVFRRLASTVPSAYLVLVGTGTLQPGIETRLREAGLLDRARFCGRRSDVPRLLKASDAFVFPSLHEGLPLACLEAQAAGLPVVMSDRITRELVVFPERVASVSLASAEAWVDLVERALQSGSDAVGGGAALAGSPFSIANSTASLVAAYRDAHANGTQAASRPAAAMRTAAADSGALSTSGGTER
jgi:glycosyltransferase involved in cell wall biosynthesis